MSAKTTGLVWELDNTVINREEKYVLLAYADHADHNGCSIYPSINLICMKTGYKERSVQNITRALVRKGFLIPDGKGPHGTNKWRYGGGANFAGVQNLTGGGAKRKGKRGAKANAPEPSEPSGGEENSLDFKNMTVADAKKVPTIKLYQQATNYFPGSLLWETVHDTITKHSLTFEKLHNAAIAWLGRGYRPANVTGILEWAVNGIPVSFGKPPASTPAPSGMPDMGDWEALYG